MFTLERFERMPVSSGRNSRIKTMTEVKEYFEIGDVFVYSPLNDPDVSIVVTTVPWKSIAPNKGLEDCKKYCALYKWCGNYQNTKFNNNTNRLESYKPVCTEYTRTDKTAVFFKEL